MWSHNPFTNKLDNKGTMGITQVLADLRYLKLDQFTPQKIINGQLPLPQLSSDPVSPNPETAWVLRSGSGGAIADGTPMGLLLALTYTDNAGMAFSYEFKYRTIENTTLSVALT